MNSWERTFFGGKCPYTDKPCVTDIDCLACSVEAEVQEWMDEMDEIEGKETEDAHNV